MIMRVQKYLSQEKILSRREAEEYIRRGLIKINGKIVREMGIKIDPEKDKVEVLRPTKNSAVSAQEKTTVAFHKPKGIISAKVLTAGEKQAGDKTVFDLLPQFNNLNIAGRLDKQSEGLLILSDDGTVAKAITGDEHTTEKEYEVQTRENVTPAALKKMEESIILDGKPILPAKTKKLSANSFNIILKEGRKHQIRRMADVARLTITNLKRIRVGNIELGKLKPGQYKRLSEREINELKRGAK